MIDGMMTDLTEAATERLALAARVTDYDARLQKLGAEMAELHRKKLDSGGPQPAKFERLREEYNRLAHERAGLVMRDQELQAAIRTTEGQIGRLQGDAARLEREIAALAPVLPGLRDQLSAVANGFTMQGDGVSLARAALFRQAVGVCEEAERLREELGRVNERRRRMGDPDAPA